MTAHPSPVGDLAPASPPDNPEDPVKPEDHYARGLHLLACAEEDSGNGDWPRASVNAVIAQSHFSAAAAGNAIRAFHAILRSEAQPEPSTATGADHHGQGDGQEAL